MEAILIYNLFGASNVLEVTIIFNWNTTIKYIYELYNGHINIFNLMLNMYAIALLYIYIYICFKYTNVYL